jgi:hypothetical protein
MTNTQEDPQKEQKRAADFAGSRLEPRLPWEVSRSALRRPRGTPASPGIDPSVFAEAGKLNILTQIGDLRKEMDNLYHDRELLESRVADLGKMLDEANERLTEAKAATSSMDQARSEWADERDELLGQVRKLQDLLQESEAERGNLVSQLEIAQATIVEIRDALNWRRAVADGQDLKDAR